MTSENMVSLCIFIGFSSIIFMLGRHTGMLNVINKIKEDEKDETIDLVNKKLDLLLRQTEVH